MPKIISAMQTMGYRPNPNGVCFGLAAMGAKAAIRKDAKSFAQRISLIHNSGHTFPVTIKKEKQLEIQSFFDELSIYQGPDSHPDFGAIFPDLQQNIANLELLTPEDELASYDLLTETEKTQIALPRVKATFVNNFTPNTFTDFVRRIMEFLGGEPFSLMMSQSAANHSVQLGFDGTKWLLANHDEIKIYNNTAANIQKLMSKLFRVEVPTDKKQKTLSVNIVLSHFSQTNFVKFENYDFDINVITPEFDRNILFELILNSQRFNKFNLLRDLINKVKTIDPTLGLFVQALQFKDQRSLSVLFRAVACNQSEIINWLIEELDSSDLSETTKSNLLSAKDDMGRSHLYYAASGGDADTVHAIVNGMSKIQLHSQRQDIIASKGLNGASAIHMVALDGHAALVELLLDVINGLNISESKKFKLITATNYDKESALHMAADEGHLDVVKLLLHAVKQKRVSEKSKLAWITSFTSSKHNALAMAAQGGHIAIAEQLFKAIDDYDVDVDTKIKYKKNLIDSKDEKGISVSMIAAIYDHVEFYRCILDMYKQLYGDTTSSILNLLTQELEKEKASVMYLAAEHGCNEMVSFLINTIMALDISELQKAKLIEAKRLSGASALSLAAQEGHSEIVDEILKAIQNMKLSESEKFHLIDTRNRNNASALLLAVNEGDMATVKILVDFILSSDLAMEAKKELLISASPESNIDSAHQHALELGHQQMANYLKAAMLLNSPALAKDISDRKHALNKVAKRSFAAISDESSADPKKRYKEKI